MTWLPDDFEHPLRADLPTGQHLRPMGAADTEIDFPAVMGSRERLWSIYGKAWGWPPAHMTLEQDRDDLAHHEREIAAHESFLYGLFEDDEAELLGCLYVDPPRSRARPAPRSPGGSSTGSSAPTSSGRSTSSCRAGCEQEWPMPAPRATSAATSPGPTGSRCRRATELGQ